MKIEITARHFTLTDAIESFVNDKVSKLEHHSDEILNCHVILSIDKYMHMAEIKINGRHFTFTAKAKTKDMYMAIEMAVKKIDTQLKKHKSITKETFTKIKGGVL